MKRKVLYLAISFFTFISCSFAQIVQVDLSGNLVRNGKSDLYSAETGTGYLLGDTFTAQITYDTSLLTNESIQRYDWQSKWISAQAVLNHEIKVFRDNQQIDQVDLIEEMPYQSTAISAFVDQEDDDFPEDCETNQRFILKMSNYDRATQTEYPYLEVSYELYLSKSDYGHQESFVPSSILDLDLYSTTRYFRIFRNHRYSLSASKYIEYCDFSIDSATVTVTPEPSAILLLGIGGLILRRRKINA